MNKDRNYNQRNNDDSVFSVRVKAGKRRTYFFDVKSSRSNDFYITITESKKKPDGDGYEKHKLHLYKEDFNRFIEAMQEAVNHVKNELMPDYDFNEFDRNREQYYNGQDEKTLPDNSISKTNSGNYNKEIPDAGQSDTNLEQDEDDLKWE